MAHWKSGERQTQLTAAGNVLYWIRIDDKKLLASASPSLWGWFWFDPVPFDKREVLKLDIKPSPGRAARIEEFKRSIQPS